MKHVMQWVVFFLLVNLFPHFSPLVRISRWEPLPRLRAELIRIVNEQFAAIERGDMETYGKDMAPELLYVPDTGIAWSKEEVLARTLRFFQAGVVKKFEDIKDVRVFENGDSAIHICQLTERLIYEGGEYVDRLRRSEHFIRRDDRWQAVLVQWTAIPINHRPAVQIDPKKLDAYVGRYKWTNGLSNTITKVDGKLMSHWREGGSKEELLALDDKTFFLKNDLGQTIFVRNRNHRVTHYVYRRSDGQEFVAKRIDPKGLQKP
jgi:hypothetical protein